MEVCAFQTEQKKANDLRICFGCHEYASHDISNCPVEANRKGMPKRLIGKCFNCGQGSHGYLECSEPLKPHLERRKQRKLSYMNKPPTKVVKSSIARSNFNPQQNSAKIDNKTVSAIFAGSADFFDPELETQIDPETGYEFIEVASVSATIKTSGDLTDRIFLRTKGSYEEFDGKVDTGAQTTVLSLQNHANGCVVMWPRVNPLMVKLADKGLMLPVVMEAAIDLRINNTVIGLCRALVVDSKSWDNVLVGKDLLAFHGLIKRIP